jgi:hypothetical protein
MDGVGCWGRLTARTGSGPVTAEHPAVAGVRHDDHRASAVPRAGPSPTLGRITSPIGRHRRVVGDVDDRSAGRDERL